MEVIRSSKQDEGHKRDSLWFGVGGRFVNFKARGREGTRGEGEGWGWQVEMELFTKGT